MAIKKIKKVWQKGKSLNLHPVIEKYDVGSDYLLDGKLFKYELAASIAHARMLSKIGILSQKELKSIQNEIKNLYKKTDGTIELSIEDEDIHSKLENLLIQKIGNTGKKLHTGRSRNDQVMVVMRLFEKEKLLETSLLYIDYLKALSDLAAIDGEKILPGYTHTKQAMPINVKFWASAFIESGLDNLKILKNTIDLINSNPLGSGSGFGVPIPLDRQMTTDLLGFNSIQFNPMASQNSRGKYEGIIIDSLWNMMNDFSRMAADMLLFNMDELLYIETNSAITTGSSIMPQKRNLDVMELVRARANVMLSYSTTVKSIASGIISGYNKDIQETKEPVFKAFQLISDTIEAITLVIKNIRFNEEAVLKTMSKGILATDIAFQAAAKGLPFRDAYRLAAEQIEDIEMNKKTLEMSLKNRVSPGSPQTINLKSYNKTVSQEETYFLSRIEDMKIKLDSLIK